MLFDVERAHTQLRARSRKILLERFGVQSNPVVDDDSIINQLRAQAGLAEIENIQWSNRAEANLNLFTQALVQILVELQAEDEVPEPSGKGPIWDAQRLMNVLDGVFGIIALRKVVLPNQDEC